MEFYYKTFYTIPYYRKTFEDAAEYSVTFLNPLTNEMLNKRPDPETWSVAQCFDHLIESGHAYLDLANPVIDKYEDTGPLGRGPFRHRFFIQWFINMLRPPYKMHFKSPQAFLPECELNKNYLLEDFLELQHNILNQIDRISGMNMSKIKVPHPLFPSFKLNISEMFAIIDAHQQRHMWQAHHILRQVNQKK